MEVMEIVLLFIGVVLFVFGFLIPDKKGKKALDTSQEEERIHNFVEEELKGVKGQISDMVEETVQYSVEKTERSLDRLTNEKMMAINEYSDTVLKEIHRNHEEVMFLYDMLNDKHTNLKNTVKEVTKSAKEAKETAQDAKIAVKEAEETAKNVMETVAEVAESAEERVLGPLEVKRVETVSAEKKAVVKKAEKNVEKKETQARTKEKKTAVSSGKDMPAGNVAIQFASGDDRANNNERILEMHKAGKSNMAIAKELGLGLGEVKLVIDLFEGI
ncbi:MAG: hypothetical protein GX234_08325 [Clostridiales bacterium]|nr:hypothetical protein [Clostridiales bacterium]